jgi:hypothetical protein
MKKKKLKIEGEEKIKFEIIFEFDEIKITLFEGVSATKYSDVLTIQNTGNNDGEHEKEFIGETILRLYSEYKKGKEIENLLIDTFEDKEYISFGNDNDEDEAYSVPY